MRTVEKERLKPQEPPGATRGVQSKSSKRKQFGSEFKHEPVRLVTAGGPSIAQVARDLGLKDNMVSRWKKVATQNGVGGENGINCTLVVFSVHHSPIASGQITMESRFYRPI